MSPRSSGFVNSVRSKPAVNASPAPVTITTPTV
ncbi:MAG: hypothetical protein A4E67_00082 [Syntrophaceae bacterium PtaB.Bin038]|nr:MAG: hypothetical protein A4E67_00082 [Syntrophaceae bacterium PtaB.Bin038]